MRDMAVTRWLSVGDWRDAMTGEVYAVRPDDVSLELAVPANGVRVLLLDAAVNDVGLIDELNRLQAAATNCGVFACP